MQSSSEGGPHSAILAVGRGWAVPAMAVFAFVGLVYLPAHPAQSAAQEILATVGAMYVIALVVAVPRVIRGAVLRRAGSREPIVVLGRDHGALTASSLAPRSRLLAVALGAASSTAGVLVAVSIGSSVAPGGYPHAIATLAAAANLTVVLGAIGPVPGSGGWAALLAIADARGASADDRVRWVARAARSVAVAVPSFAVALAIVTGDPMLAVLGAILGLFVWTQAGAAAHADQAERFLARHTASDLARPLTATLRTDESVPKAALDVRGAVSIVMDEGGALVGVLGPRQIRAACAGNLPCAGAMVPMRSVSVVAGQAAATAALGDLARHGFAVVRDAEGLGVIETDDLRRQIHLWAALADRGRVRLAPGPRRTSGAPPLDP
jgi:hypothetical protein